MAAADNPYYINPANPLTALMSGVQGYESAQKRTKQSEMEAGRKEAMTALQSGGDLRTPMAKLLGIGDVEGAKAISTFAEHQANRQFREGEADRAQTNADRTYNLHVKQFDEGKRPAGFQYDDTGGLTPTRGGPADPAYLAAASEAKAKPREMSLTDIDHLTKEGGKFSSLVGFKDTFEPRFAGYKTEGVGNAATFLGRNFPSAVSKDTVDAAQWWQGYDRFKNVVRNELFGAALTATEKAAFERADINAGMDPKTIQKNLEMQHQVAMNGLKRKANASIAAGYDPKAIGAAYGLNLQDIGVKDQGRARGPAASAAPQAAPPSSPANEFQNGTRARNAEGVIIEYRDGQWYRAQ